MNCAIEQARLTRRPPHDKALHSEPLYSRVPHGGVVHGEGVMAHEDVPIGAIVVNSGGQVLGTGYNQREAHNDPTAHAEVLALRAAGLSTGQWRLHGLSLVVTLEPCVMCAGAAVAARVDRIIFGAWDDKAGACGSVWDIPRDGATLHRPEVYGGINAEGCQNLLRNFFQNRR